MRKVFLAAMMVLLFAGASVADEPGEFVSQLTSTTTDEVLVLRCIPKVLPSSLTEYSYWLTNPVSNTDRIRAFTLAFPVAAGDFAVTATPGGWSSVVVIPDQKINWQWIDFDNPDRQLDPGETFHFAFVSALPFGGPAVGNAAAINGNGYSGVTCGPIPEASTVMLGLMGLGSLSGLLKLRRK